MKLSPALIREREEAMEHLRAQREEARQRHRREVFRAIGDEWISETPLLDFVINPHKKTDSPVARLLHCVLYEKFLYLDTRPESNEFLKMGRVTPKPPRSATNDSSKSKR